MMEKAQTPAGPGSTATPAPATSRRSLNRDPREAMAELTQRAHEISLEAGTRVSAAMRDVISAGAGLAGFAVESARDLVQYLVRRGQMTQDEADKLIREAEQAYSRRPASERARPSAAKVAADRVAAERAALHAATRTVPPPVAKKTVAKTAAKPAAKPAAAKKPSPVKAGAKKAPAKDAPTKKASVKAASAKKAPATKAAPGKKVAAKPATRRR